MAAPLLALEEVTVAYGTPGGRLRALDAVSLAVGPGEAVALVGESGSGKSTAALAAMGLLGPEAHVSGRIAFKGRDLATLSAEERRGLRGRDMSIVFQDPFTSLNPSLPIGLQVAEPLHVHRGLGEADARAKVLAALAEVGLPDPPALLGAFPHQLSGGMQQRVLIATALVCDPALLILDEPTTALDVTVEARILDLLADIRRRRDVGILFITHNLGVVNRIADRVCVLYAGRLAEAGPKAAVLGAAAHPYTKGLLASVPRLGAGGGRRLMPIPGRFPDLARLPPGCVFAPRCPFAEDRCGTDQAMQPLGPGHAARCCKAAALRSEPWPALAAAPARGDGARVAGGAVVARDLVKTFARGRGFGALTWTRRFGLPWPRLARGTVAAVDGVSLDIAPGEVLGLVGESGSGKSTLGRLLIRLIEPSGGSVRFDGTALFELPGAALRAFRKRAQIVFQNPDSSLNPRRTVGAAVARPLVLHADPPARELRARVEALLDRVGLPRHYYDRYPHQLSGGEKQRIGIARALATGPSFVVCDEPVSALDVSVQATVVNLLADLRGELGLSYLFISHDLGVVAHVSDRIAVMYAGRIVEVGPTARLLEPPYHPYTEALLSAAPAHDGAVAAAGVVLRADPGGERPRAGCPFHPRCHRKLGAICESEAPPLADAGDGHRLACHIPLDELRAVESVVPRDGAGGRP